MSTTEPAPGPRDTPGAGDGVRLTHIGGPTVLVEIGGWRILTDPTFDPPGRRYAFGWGTSSRKVAGPAVPAAGLGRLDAVLVTHDHHADNLDDAGRALLADVPVVVTTVSGAARLGGGARGLEVWSATHLRSPGRPTIEITATPCRHGPPLSHALVGDVIGFALRIDGRDTVAVWFSGDTVLFGGVREVARRFDVDVAVLHVGGVRFGLTGPLRYTMTAAPALELCAQLRPRVAVPVHYEGWSHFREGRAAIERHLARARPEVRDRFRFLPFGQPTELGHPDDVDASSR